MRLTTLDRAAVDNMLQGVVAGGARFLKVGRPSPAYRNWEWGCFRRHYDGFGFGCCAIDIFWKRISWKVPKNIAPIIGITLRSKFIEEADNGCRNSPDA